MGSKGSMDRREFATLLPALLACSAVMPESALAQSNLPVLQSGVFPPEPAKTVGIQERVSRHYVTGMLKAGNVRLEMHETTQAVGAPHEPIGTHLHNELWLVREGTVELMTNGVSRRMVAGDVGICVAGDKHFIKNVGDTPATYFVVTVGPPE
ncbi:MAG TPA: cupin domain-containing protein [Edaphobacter sp.]|uniref:cupin domain-containing protein n=1 Tax=Edaphobacter sp. TaxID=1934404 RepID=UPI002B6EB27C|nr:cupin domain-containing protein [Edaphobacter sp.]HUZ96947.1 cupin domain-containing protein [Edaphobacter sp.]